VAPCAGTALPAAVDSVTAGRRSTTKANVAATSMSPLPIKRHVQAVDEGAVSERLGSGPQLLCGEAALSTAHILNDVRSTCLG
jgi:hypothetical protein